MTLVEKAKEYNMEVDALLSILMSDPTNANFFKKHDITGNHPIDSLSERAIDEIMKKQNADSSETEHDPVSSENAEETPEDATAKETPAENEDPVEDKKPLRSSRKKATKDVQSEIDMVPNMILRKFYAENCNVKPEKIFYMDDAAVKTKVDEKYIVLERDSDFLFIKRTSAIVSVSK